MIYNFKNIFADYEPYINGSQDFKRSSVIVPIVNINSNPHILFEKRSLNLKSHPGEICFPGGKIEQGESPLDAALRETFEELNISSKDINVICPLDLFISPFNALIHPFLAEILNIDSLKINEEEVSNIICIPLSFFLEIEPKKYLNEIIVTPNSKFPYEMVPKKNNHTFNKGSYEIIFYEYNGTYIWGLTARILYNFVSYFKNHLADK